MALVVLRQTRGMHEALHIRGFQGSLGIKMAQVTLSRDIQWPKELRMSSFSFWLHKPVINPAGSWSIAVRRRCTLLPVAKSVKRKVEQVNCLGNRWWDLTIRKGESVLMGGRGELPGELDSFSGTVRMCVLLMWHACYYNDHKTDNDDFRPTLLRS